MDLVAISAIGALVVLAVGLERGLERLNRRSAWGAFLVHDRLGRTLYIPPGPSAYVVTDPTVIRRIELLSARGWSSLLAGGVLLVATVGVFVAVEEHELAALVGILAVAGWAAVIGWVVHQMRRITRGLPDAR